MDPLVSVLRGEMDVHVHVYEAQDMETVIRLSKEFGFKIKAFHHSAEAWKIPDMIRENNITVLLFADLCKNKNLSLILQGVIN